MGGKNFPVKSRISESEFLKLRNNSNHSEIALIWDLGHRDSIRKCIADVLAGTGIELTITGILLGLPSNVSFQLVVVFMLPWSSM